MEIRTNKYFSTVYVFREYISSSVFFSKEELDKLSTIQTDLFDYITE
ncbi:MAG: hypothetical protein U0Z74_01800 [Romboutsia timonensis]